MTGSRLNIIAWVAELIGLLVVLLGVFGALPDRFMFAGLLLMVVGILAKMRANRLNAQG